MSVKLYANENFPFALVEKLRKFGFDVQTMKEKGLSNRRISDLQVIEYAYAEQRAVITFNKRDFSRLHRTNPNHYGIILCTMDIDLDALANRINEGIKNYDQIKGRLIRIHR